MGRPRPKDADRRLALHAKLGFQIVSRSQRLPGWDKSDQTALARSFWFTPRVIGRLMIAVAVILVVGLAIFSSNDASSLSRANVPRHATSLKGQGPLDILSDATRVVEHYLAATSIADKAHYARRPQVVKSLMERYYQDHPLQPISPKMVKMIGKLDDLNREHPLYLAAAMVAKDQVIPLVIEEREGHYRIDWESQVGFSPTTIDEFVTQPFGQTMWFRLYATISDYYNYIYSNAKTYLCLELDFPGRLQPCYGYVSVDHPDYQSIRRVLGQRKRVPMILNVQREEGGGTNQLLVTSFEQERWFIDQDPGSYASAWSLAR